VQLRNLFFYFSPIRLTFKVHFYLCISKGRLLQGQFKDRIISVESLEVQRTKSILLEYEPLENALRGLEHKNSCCYLLLTPGELQSFKKTVGIFGFVFVPFL